MALTVKLARSKLAKAEKFLVKCEAELEVAKEKAAKKAALDSRD